MNHLLAKAAGSMGWSAISQVGRKVTQFATLAVLARLLSPSDFGLAAMAAVVVEFAIIFRDLGTAAAVIQRPELSGPLLNTVFWVNALFGLLVTLVLLASAPLIAVFYQEPRITELLQVLSLTFFISSLSTLQQALLERRLAFMQLAKLELAAALLSAGAGVSAALAGWGVWSLVLQSLVLQFFQTIFLWFAGGFRPAMQMHWSELKSIREFSLNLTAWQVMNYGIRNADNVLIGWYLGAQALGYYSLAYRIMMLPLQTISAVASRVLFPIYARLQGDNAQFRSTYTLAASGIATLAFPIMTGVMVLREPFVGAIFGEGWQPVAALLLVLAPLGLIQSLATTVGAIYQAKARTHTMLRWGIVAGLSSLAAYAAGLPFGIMGVAVSYLVINIILFYPNFAIPFGFIGLGWGEFLRPLAAPAGVSLAMGAVLWGLEKVLLPEFGQAPRLALLVAAGAILVVSLTLLVDRKRIQTAWRMVQQRGAAKSA